MDGVVVGSGGVELEQEDAPIAPDEIQGLKMWLAADMGITKDGDNRVSRWADQSGNGYDAISSGADKPLLVEGLLNGKPVLRFNDNQMTIADGTGLETYTRFFVLKASTPYGQQYGRVYIDPGFAFGWRAYGEEISFSMTPAATTYAFRADSWPDQKYNIATISRIKDSDIAFRVNQIDAGRISEKRRWVEVQCHIIGADPTYAPLNFDLAEIITYDRVLSYEEKEKVETYLADNTDFPAKYLYTK